MVIDSSAILAILTAELDAKLFAEAIATAPVRLLSAASLFETAIVIEARHGIAGGEKLDEFLIAAQIVVEPVTRDQIALARIGYRTFGKGHLGHGSYSPC